MIRYILSTLIFIIAFYILVYNHIRHLSINVENTWSDIDVQLKRRNDLIPNLVLIVKGQTQYERSTLIQITKLRQALNQALDTDQPNRKRITALNQQLNLDLQELTIFVENYPDLKANEQYLNLQHQLTNTEEKIAAARRFYNISVNDLNSTIGSFPINLIAKIHHITSKPFFER